VFLGTGVYATSISAASGNTCAVLSSSKLLCWGGNFFGKSICYKLVYHCFVVTHPYVCAYLLFVAQGQLGVGSSDFGGNTETPGKSKTVDFGHNAVVTAVSVGDSFVCAIVNGAVKCWGLNKHGQLGQGTNVTLGDTAATAPAKIKPIK
jgi:hypothetical protein